jgi:predicted DNA-binding transcriptional regulator AlpA
MAQAGAPGGSVAESPDRRPFVGPPARRGLCRAEAAGYVGVSPSFFDKMIADGRMPKAIRVDGRRIWDRCALDLAFDQLSINSSEEGNPWDGA